MLSHYNLLSTLTVGTWLCWTVHVPVPRRRQHWKGAPRAVPVCLTWRSRTLLDVRFERLNSLNSLDFTGGSDDKVSVYNAGNLGLIPGLGRFPGEGNGNPLQYSCLENPMDGGAWCRPLSMGSQRVGHDWATSLHFTSNSLKEVPKSFSIAVSNFFFNSKFWFFSH